MKKHRSRARTWSVNCNEWNDEKNESMYCLEPDTEMNTISNDLLVLRTDPQLPSD